MVILLLFVDDMLLAGDDPLITWTVQQISSHFRVNDLGTPRTQGAWNMHSLRKDILLPSTTNTNFPLSRVLGGFKNEDLRKGRWIPDLPAVKAAIRFTFATKRFIQTFNLFYMVRFFFVFETNDVLYINMCGPKVIRCALCAKSPGHNNNNNNNNYTSSSQYTTEMTVGPGSKNDWTGTTMLSL